MRANSRGSAMGNGHGWAMLQVHVAKQVSSGQPIGIQTLYEYLGGH